MARLSIYDPSIRTLIDTVLAPLCLKLRSVNSVAETLNSILKAHSELGTIYPNRLHALFAEDPSRGLNAGTIALIERAGALLGAEALELSGENATRAEQLAREAAVRWRATEQSPDALRGLAANLRLPAAVLRYLLVRHGERVSNAAGLASLSAVSESLLHPSGPDWSFQDDAVRKAVAKLCGPSVGRTAVVIPTGGGKTRVGLRIAIEALAHDSSNEKTVLWVTHRLGLRRQAHRALQQLLRPGHKFPENFAALAKRIDFIMVSELEQRLITALPALVIVDEAHHAAAASYDPLFEVAVPVLGLTATPRRTDLQPIRVDDIAYQITYRELAERGVILKPEFRDFEVLNFDWSPAAIEDLADDVLTGAESDYVKTLVIAPRIDRVEEFYEALTKRLASEESHVLSPDDIGYIHSQRNSLNLSADDFLDAFASKPRGIIVSAQMLLEGFDDPAINTVIVTYPSSSVVLLMQAAGRCVRYAEGKKAAYVIQARNDEIAYHFDQRWLYQEISDTLRPELGDVNYHDKLELTAKVTAVLDRHQVKAVQREKILSAVAELSPGQLCRLMLAGLPYSGSEEDFETQSEWFAILETSATSEQLRSLFNDFSENGEEFHPQAFLSKAGEGVGVRKDLSAGSSWRAYSTLFGSMVNARREIQGVGIRAIQKGRPYKDNGSTTWLRYYSFHFEPLVPLALSDFLRDCYNREVIIGNFQAARDTYTLVIKIAVPMGGFEAHLLCAQEASALIDWIDKGRVFVGASSVDARFAAFAAYLAGSPKIALPRRVVDRLEGFLESEQYAERVLELSNERLS